MSPGIVLEKILIWSADVTLEESYLEPARAIAHFRYIIFS